MIISKCPECGMSFTAGRNGRKYCSLLCRGRAQTKRSNSSAQCEYCGQPFLAKLCYMRKGLVRFCSRKCYELGRVVSPAIRFWAKVDKRGENECWPWLGARSSGYGKFGIRDGESPQNAHRVAYALTHGEIPEGKQINHTCDNRRCVNPAHLYAGTAKQNTGDAINRGRWRSPFVR